MRDICPNCQGQIVELENGELEEEDEIVTEFDCEILNYPGQIEEELTTQQVVSWQQNLISIADTAKKRIQELEQKNAATKKDLAEVQAALQWKEASQKNWLAELAEEQDKNANLEKAHAATKKKLEVEEEECEAQENANDKINAMLTEIMKFSEEHTHPQRHF